MIKGKNRAELVQEERAKWEELTIEEHMDVYLANGMDKTVAKDCGVSKRDIYQALL